MITETLEERKQFNLARAQMAREIVIAGGLVLHAAACAKNGRAYVFSGPSGAGKSTAMDHSSDAEVLSEEAIALERIGGVWHARGLPYAGDARFTEKSEKAFPVAGIYRLHHARENVLVSMRKAEAAHELVTVPECLHCGDLLFRAFAAAAQIAEDVVCFHLYLRNDETFWKIL